MSVKSMSLLDELLGAWTYTRDGVVAELKNLPESSLDFKPNDQTRTTREIVQHIIESGLLMSGELSRPDGDFLRKPYPELLEEHARGVSRHRTKKALVEALKRTHTDGAERFRAAGEVAMLQTIRQFNGERALRLTWMHHGIAHEEYHRGQLALYARLVGRVPALTRLIQGG
ncbi:MAG: DinB family protein [Acidobacteria bacterium]|nr:DinB family protein [Acidobacteriota bacterium]